MQHDQGAEDARRASLHPQLVERLAAGIARRVAEILLDAQQLVVLGDAVGARQRAGLDLQRVGGHRDVGDRGVLGLARAVRDHRRVARALGHLDRGERLGQRADLVDLDQDRVGDALARCPRAGSRVLVTNRSSPTSCTCLPSRSVSSFQPSQSFSAMPSSIDDDRILRRRQLGEVVGELRRASSCGPRTSSVYSPSSIELGARAVERRARRPRPACSPPCSIASRMSSSAASLIGRSGAKPPSSPTAVGSPCVDQIFFSAWNTSAPQRSASRKRRRADRHDHELLHVEAVVGVRAAVDDVHHRHRHRHRRPRRRGSGTAAARDSSAAALATASDTASIALAPRRDLLSVPSSSISVLSMNACSVASRPTMRLADLGVDVLDRLQHALAEVALLVAVAQLDRLARCRWRRPRARPRGPSRRDSSSTSASTVGLPRESRISRAMTSTMALMIFV